MRVIDCRGKRRCTHPSPSLRRAARWSEPNTPSLLAHPCSTCTPHMSRAGNTTAQRHLVGTSLKHNLHFSKRRCHTSPTPPTRQTTPQAEYLHNTVRYIWNYTHTHRNVKWKCKHTLWGGKPPGRTTGRPVGCNNVIQWGDVFKNITRCQSPTSRAARR